MGVCWAPAASGTAANFIIRLCWFKNSRFSAPLSEFKRVSLMFKS